MADATNSRKKTKAVAAPPVGEQKTIVEQIAAKRSAFSLKEFAELTGISYNTAFDMAKDGRLPVMRVGSSIRCDPATTAQWLRQRTSA
jgi:excisionase family DNA binding protein